MKYLFLDCALLAIPFSISAHHDMSDDVDLDTHYLISGHIEAVEWTNPHVLIHVREALSPGNSRAWIIHADNPNTLLRRGLTPVTFTYIQTAVDFVVYPSTSGTCTTLCYGYGLSFTDPAGRTLLLDQFLRGLVTVLP